MRVALLCEHIDVELVVLIFGILLALSEFGGVCVVLCVCVCVCVCVCLRVVCMCVWGGASLL